MPLIIFALGIYILFAEWRNLGLRKRLTELEKSLNKFKKDKTLWYSEVLPSADEWCLFEENSGSFLVSKLSDKYWMDKSGEIDFTRIKRWVYIEDLQKL